MKKEEDRIGLVEGRLIRLEKISLERNVGISPEDPESIKKGVQEFFHDDGEESIWLTLSCDYTFLGAWLPEKDLIIINLERDPKKKIINQLTLVKTRDRSIRPTDIIPPHILPIEIVPGTDVHHEQNGRLIFDNGWKFFELDTPRMPWILSTWGVKNSTKLSFHFAREGESEIKMIIEAQQEK